MPSEAIELGEIVNINDLDGEKAEALVTELKKNGDGGTENRSRAEIYIADNRGPEHDHAKDVVVKEVEVSYGNENVLFGDENLDQSPAERYFQRWLYLKKIGVSVLESLSFLADGKRVIMKDVTADGSEFIDKETFRGLGHGDTFVIDGRLSECQKKFLEIDKDELKQKIHDNFSIAWNLGISLPDDWEEFAVLVHPDGDYDVLVLDLTKLNYVDVENGVDYNGKNFAERWEHISYRVDKIYEGLEIMKNAEQEEL